VSVAASRRRKRASREFRSMSEILLLFPEMLNTAAQPPSTRRDAPPPPGGRGPTFPRFSPSPLVGEGGERGQQLHDALQRADTLLVLLFACYFAPPLPRAEREQKENRGNVRVEGISAPRYLLATVTLSRCYHSRRQPWTSSLRGDINADRQVQGWRYDHFRA
jgi:hypothetical protein